MPKITVQDGKIVLRDGKLGTGAACCCSFGCSTCGCSAVVSIGAVSFPADGNPYAICLTENATWIFGAPFTYAVTHATAEVVCQEGQLIVTVSVGYSQGPEGFCPFVLGELHTPGTGVFESFANVRYYVFDQYDQCGCATGAPTLTKTDVFVTPPLSGECQSELHAEEWSDAYITLDCECGNPLP
jgi:hypothetical protein